MAKLLASLTMKSPKEVLASYLERSQWALVIQKPRENAGEMVDEAHDSILPLMAPSRYLVLARPMFSICFAVMLNIISLSFVRALVNATC